MGVSVAPREGSAPYRIHVDGAFDFSVYREFREAYKGFEKGSDVLVDLSRATYLDSSALGMLLMLREHVGGGQGNIRLQVSDVPEIRRVVEIARFGDLFHLE